MDFFGVQDTILWHKNVFKGHLWQKKEFVKLEISNNFKQNIDETDFKNNQKSIGKSIPAYGLKISKKKKSANQKSGDFWQNFVISIKKTILLGMDWKIYRKSIALPVDFYSLWFPSLNTGVQRQFRIWNPGEKM